MSKQTTPIPQPLFDFDMATIPAQLMLEFVSPLAHTDSAVALQFLRKYDGNASTFNNYKRELERLCNWAWLVVKKSLLSLSNADIEQYLRFCQKPPQAWIGIQRVPRFIVDKGQRLPNPAWRPFVATINKSAHKQGKKPAVAHYQLSQSALALLLAALSSFYQHLLQTNLVRVNPVQLIAQTSKYLRQHQGQRAIRRLSPLQWELVIETAETMAKTDPIQHERTLFVITALYLMYLRISELVATSRWLPQMGHFYQDMQGNWWFKTVSKGNKERQISVSDQMLEALKRYRTSRNLFPALPNPQDPTPLLHRLNGQEPITSDRHIRTIVQGCFDQAIQKLRDEGFAEEAQALSEATVHWLRHTGISDDLNKRGRPIAHVRDDAGHSSSATTDRYNDINLQERHRSARKKRVQVDG